MKSKKIVGAIVAVVMSASLAAGLSACKGGHSHSWQWKDVGGGYHREECSCGETKSPEPHRNDDGDNLCDDCHVDLTTVVQVTNVTLDKTSATLTVGGETLTLTATVTPAGAAQVIWESSDPSVAKVEGGVVTALKAGDTVITARAGSKSATCSVKVNAAAPSKPVDMTEEKWEQAFTFSGKVGFEQEVEVEGRKHNTKILKDGDKYYNRQDDFETYIEINGENGYGYTKTYAYWTKEEVLADDMNVGFAMQALDALKDLMPFDKFKKDTANGEYVSKESSYTAQTTIGEQFRTMTLSDVTLNFSGEGKLVAAEYTVSEQGHTQKYAITFIYGETVTLPTVLEGEQVTASEWTAALAVTDTNYRAGVGSYGSLGMEYVQDGLKKKLVLSEYFSDNTEREEMYFAKEGDKFYRYEGKNNHWSKVELNGMTDEIYGSEITALGYLELDFGEYDFEAFTYDAKTKAYTMTSDGTTVSAMFKNKKLVWANVTGEYENNTIEFVYGDAQVTLPTVDAGEQISDPEWATAQAMDFDNVEVTVSFGMGEMTYKKVGSTYCREIETMGNTIETYAVEEGGKYYLYSVKNSVWDKSEIAKSEYDQMHPSCTLSGINKSDFTWDAVSKTYKGVLDQVAVEIKFVDKKFDSITSDVQNMYFSYGTAEFTVPEEGSHYGGGGSIIVGPSTEKDITEEEWQQYFEDTEKSEILWVSKYTEDDSVQYLFNGEDGYIAVKVYIDGEPVEYVFADEDGIVYKFEQVDGQITKTAAEYGSLAEIKAEVLGGAFTEAQFGDVREQYENFGGNKGAYFYRISNDEYVGVYTVEGKLIELSYRHGEDELSYYFEQHLMDVPSWYVQYMEPRVSQGEWNKAFEMAYDMFYVRGNAPDREPYAISKDGKNYFVEDRYGTKYYSEEGGKYYRFYSEFDETAPHSQRWIKEEIAEEEFTASTRVSFFGTYNYDDFSVIEDESGTYYQNSDGTCSIRFVGKRIDIIEFYNKELGEFGKEELRFGYYGTGISMPQDKLTEEEWIAAINASLASANFTCYEEHLDESGSGSCCHTYLDIDNGLIYKILDDYKSDDLIYVVKNGNTYRCEYDVENGYSEAVIPQTLQELRAAFAQEILTTDALNGQSILQNYSNFEYNGFGDYILNLESGGRIRVEFRNGKLWTIDILFNSDPMSPSDRYNFNDFGTTDVEDKLPWWYIYENKNGK